MAKTKNEIRDRAANDLGLLRLGQDLDAQNSTRILAGYDEIYQQLKKDGLAIWASTASVPAEIAPYMIALVALNCVATFGVSDKRVERIVLTAGIDGELAKKQIRKIVTADFVSQDEPVDY